MKLLLSLIVCAAISMQLGAQDLAHYKKIVKELSSAKYQGRGYAEDGANKAGKWIAKEFTKIGADEVVCQPFKLDINTFPGKMDVSIDGKKLIPGVDFTVREFNPSLKGEFKLYYVDTLNYNPDKIFADLSTPEYEGAFVVCDFMFCKCLSSRVRAQFPAPHSHRKALCPAHGFRPCMRKAHPAENRKNQPRN